MLVETISFRIFDAVAGTDDNYLIENTPLHQELIFQNRHTHGIEFTQTFDFQFTTERRAPKFIEFGDVYDEALANNWFELELDDVDEMVGSF